MLVGAGADPHDVRVPAPTRRTLLGAGLASATPYQKSYLRLGPSIVTTPEQVDTAVQAVAGLV